jgi:hypothetical protein
MSMIVIGLLLPIIRQKMALSAVSCLLTACIMGSKWLDYISSIKTESTLHNSNTEQKEPNRTKALESKKALESNKST